jgi:tryptophan-rich sensory protein
MELPEMILALPHLTTFDPAASSEAICLGAGGLGAIATTPEIDGWYRTLAKPAWNPPDIRAATITAFS